MTFHPNLTDNCDPIVDELSQKPSQSRLRRSMLSLGMGLTGS
jgi:hypothetical protein